VHQPPEGQTWDCSQNPDHTLEECLVLPLEQQPRFVKLRTNDVILKHLIKVANPRSSKEALVVNHERVMESIHEKAKKTKKRKR
jgi:hypothetical protein